jgi:RNA polymerase sigma-70 factor (ECF subfamily)
LIMATEQDVHNLVIEACAGHVDAMNTLAQRAEGRLCAYLYRVTLDRDLTQDLCQEVLLTMVRSLSGLDHPERFWPWLYRIAQSKVQQHFRTRLRKQPSLDSDSLRNRAVEVESRRQDDGLQEAMRREMTTKVVAAMKRLAEPHRAVLALRCFDELSYADIALTMDCSEVRARVLFYRAKEALKKQLSRQGIRKGLLAVCLGAFGQATAPSEASTTVVTAASTHVGATTVLLANMGPLAAFAAAVAIIAAVVSWPSRSVQNEPNPLVNPVRSFHFTSQLEYTQGPEADNSLSKGAYEQWFYFPQGRDGPMFFRMQRWDPQQKTKLCAWLQDAQANYYYDSGKNVVHINNYRVFWSSLKVRRLPTDDAEFTAFLNRMEGDDGNITYERDPSTGWLTGATDYRFKDACGFHARYEYNTLQAQSFEAHWPSEAPMVDERDAMHKRGWTYVQVEGRIDGRDVSGTGCIPFFYQASLEHPAWLKLQVGEDLEIRDSGSNAAVCRPSGESLSKYPGGTFLEGLPRPWMGMHALDSVRRDAARHRIAFMTRSHRDERYVTVVLRPTDSPTTSLEYTIDVETDIVSRIAFQAHHQDAGEMRFTYLQEIDGVPTCFDPPLVSDSPSERPRNKITDLWLISLAARDSAF